MSKNKKMTTALFYAKVVLEDFHFTSKFLAFDRVTRKFTFVDSYDFPPMRFETKHQLCVLEDLMKNNPIVFKLILADKCEIH